MNDLMNKELQRYCEKAINNAKAINEERKEVLHQLVDYLSNHSQSGATPQLNFICTHNSRRSHLSQIWAFTAAYYYQVSCNTYSGGTEATAFHPNAVAAIKKAGFSVAVVGESNPRYTIGINESTYLTAWSKTFNDSTNPQKDFAAIMTCEEADSNCPIIPGADVRIPLRYEDPKHYDGTPQQQAKYEERSFQIATEMFYVFGLVAS